MPLSLSRKYLRSLMSMKEELGAIKPHRLCLGLFLVTCQVHLRLSFQVGLKILWNPKGFIHPGSQNEIAQGNGTWEKTSRWIPQGVWLIRKSSGGMFGEMFVAIITTGAKKIFQDECETRLVTYWCTFPKARKPTGLQTMANMIVITAFPNYSKDQGTVLFFQGPESVLGERKQSSLRLSRQCTANVSPSFCHREI